MRGVREWYEILILDDINRIPTNPVGWFNRFDIQPNMVYYVLLLISNQQQTLIWAPIYRVELTGYGEEAQSFTKNISALQDIQIFHTCHTQILKSLRMAI